MSPALLLPVAVNPTFLALDPGTKCGWARSREGETTFGVWSLAPKDGIVGSRYAALDAHLTRVHAQSALDIIAIEQAHHRGGRATEYALGYLAVVHLWAYRRAVEVVVAHASAVKRHATGHGDANKREMVAAAAARWNYCADDNEADALWILDWAIGRVGQ
jgi:Holliday junction resolvasome RuvABC endonuclease subunit